MIEIKAVKNISQLNRVMNINPSLQKVRDSIYYESCNILEDLTINGFEACGFSKNYIMHYPEEFSVKYDIDKTIYYHLDKMLFYIEDSLSDDCMSIRWEVKFV